MSKGSYWKLGTKSKGFGCRECGKEVEKRYWVHYNLLYCETWMEFDVHPFGERARDYLNRGYILFPSAKTAYDYIESRAPGREASQFLKEEIERERTEGICGCK